MSRRCHLCQSTVPDNAKFCPECGASMAAACPSCGAPAIGGRFCARGLFAGLKAEPWLAQVDALTVFR